MKGRSHGGRHGPITEPKEEPKDDERETPAPESSAEPSEIARPLGSDAELRALRRDVRHSCKGRRAVVSRAVGLVPARREERASSPSRATGAASWPRCRFSGAFLAHRSDRNGLAPNLALLHRSAERKVKRFEILSGALHDSEDDDFHRSRKGAAAVQRSRLAPTPPMCARLTGMTRDRCPRRVGVNSSPSARIWSPSGWSVSDVRSLASEPLDAELQVRTVRGRSLEAFLSIQRIGGHLFWTRRRPQPAPHRFAMLVLLRDGSEAGLYVVPSERLVGRQAAPDGSQLLGSGEHASAVRASRSVTTEGPRILTPWHLSRDGAVA